MKNNELSKRIITSIFLFSLLYLMFMYVYILIITLIIISIISWIEFYSLIVKIFSKNNITITVLKFILKILSLSYLTIFSVLVFNELTHVEFINKVNIIYLLFICIASDVGGLVFGKVFKGKKLIKISPNKTISGSIGSFILSLSLVPFIYYFMGQVINFFDLIILTIIVSFFCQLGDLFISYLKRKANVKDTGDLLPGHGGFLDRIDGMLFAIPIGITLFEIFII